MKVLYFFEILFLHDDIIIFMFSLNNSSFISFCRTQCMTLNPPLLLFEVLIVDQPDCTKFLHLLGLSLVPVLVFGTAESKMVRWINRKLSEDLRSLLSLFFEDIV